MKKILSSEGAAREMNANSTAYVKDLAVRDVKIVNGEVRGKYAMRSRNGKGLHERLEGEVRIEPMKN